MTATVIHVPRVAWDGARAFVRVAQTYYFDVFAADVRAALGPEMYDKLQATRAHVLDHLYGYADERVLDAEAGMWRARLEDLQHEDPGATAEIIRLTRSVPRF